MKKNNATITFRPSEEVFAKLQKAMKCTRQDRSKTLRKALELGLDYLESQGYDASKALIKATILKPETPTMPTPRSGESLKVHPREKRTNQTQNG